MSLNDFCIEEPAPVSRKLFYIKHFRSFFRTALDLAFPPLCFLCKTSLGPFRKPTICTACWNEIWSPHIAYGHLAIGRYEGALRTIISLAKFEAHALALDLSCHILKRALIELKLNTFDQITTVPMHPSHVRKRGVHFSGHLAYVASRTLEIPFSPNLVKRTRDVSLQQELSRRERKKNLRGAFLSKPCESLRILIIDDVVTTGTTANEIIQSLHKAGATSTFFLSLSATPSESFTSQ